LSRPSRKGASAERLDVWLYRSRLIKSRALAVQLIEKGKVRLTRHNETRRITKPGFSVAFDDQLSFMRGTTFIQVEIVGFPTRRGPAAEAREFYRIIDMQARDRDDG